MHILYNDQIRVTSISITLQLDCFFYFEARSVTAEVDEWIKFLLTKAGHLNSILESRRK